MRTITFEVTITQEEADYLREPEQASVKRAIEDLCEYGCVGVRDVEVTKIARMRERARSREKVTELINEALLDHVDTTGAIPAESVSALRYDLIETFVEEG